MQVVVWGYQISAEAARRIVAILLAERTTEARSTAQAIDRAVRDEGGLVALDDEQRDALLFALEDDGGDEQVAELRGALVRDHEHRTGPAA